MIKDLLVHLDDTPASPARLEAALALAAACGAQLTALYLIAEPFLRGVAGLHAPAEVIREHLAPAEAEAEAVFAAARELAGRRQVSLATRRETGSLDRLPTLLGRDARTADLVIVGQPDPQAGGTDAALLAEAAFMDSGRPALVLPHTDSRAAAMPPRRAMVAWDGSREAARAAHDALPLLRLAGEAVVLVVDARDLGARVGQQPGADVAAHLAHHEVKTRVKRVASGGGSDIGDGQRHRAITRGVRLPAALVPWTELDRVMMRRAIARARAAMGTTWPNPAVGCVITQAGVVISEAATQPGGRPHAEAMALARAGSRAYGATAYVTFEPCAHYGRTPPCADALIAAGIRRVVIADGHDPDPRVSGRGVTRLRAAGIQVETGLLRDEAWPAHAEFVARSCSWHEGHHS